MNEINYGAMSDRDLKRYFLEHRDDQAAFHAYMDRRYARPNRISISPDDPDWETKIRASIEAQMGQADRSG